MFQIKIMLQIKNPKYMFKNLKWISGIYSEC